MKRLWIYVGIFFLSLGADTAYTEEPSEAVNQVAAQTDSQRVPAQINEGMSPETQQFLKQAGNQINSVFEKVEKKQ